jgi:hypothetical protein
MTDVSQLLSAIEEGAPPAAEQLLPLVCEELRKLAAQEMVWEQPGQARRSCMTSIQRGNRGKSQRGAVHLALGEEDLIGQGVKP